MLWYLLAGAGGFLGGAVVTLTITAGWQREADDRHILYVSDLRTQHQRELDGIRRAGL